jgi:hypothetical protein
VHIYTALVGRPSDFFNEGIAVALQTDPPGGNLESFFNGQQVHEACRQYLQFGTLVVPLDRAMQTDNFRAITDQVLSPTALRAVKGTRESRTRALGDSQAFVFSFPVCS